MVLRYIGVELSDHPPFSPDLNPIENLWKLLKAKIIELYPELVTMKDNDQTNKLLIRALQET
jgi:transposase